MKKTLLSLGFAIAATCFFMCSCDGVKEYKKPIIAGIEMEPNPCAPGDTVRAFLKYDVAGECWYWYSQTFSTPTTHFKEYKGSCQYPSQCFFIAPNEAGTYPVKFKGQVTITSGQELWGEKYEFENKLVVK